MASVHRNISFAAAESFGDILHSGRTIEVRGRSTKELTNRVTVLERPLERFLFLPGRLNDVFAQVAETLWVLNGRDDLEWLVRYLPRAFEFSDDGKIWRAAYGPRLRRWKETVDQLAEVRALLTQDRSSRRAVMALFDPASDFRESLDIPCNNWLSWLIRDDVLHLSVALRSNDALWGFSGTNAFEWSVLHELMAHWTSSHVGSLTFFATSFHLYDEYFDQARRVSQRFHSISPYDFGVAHRPMRVAWTDLDATLQAWFAAEAAVRANPDVSPNPFPDPFLSGALAMLRLKWGSARWNEDRLRLELAELPDDEMTAAAYEHFARKRPTFLDSIPQPGIARFFEACSTAASIAPKNLLAGAIKTLHLRKDRDYGGAWKRRGEQVSVLPNIARKVDRLETFLVAGRESLDETLLDTAIDLYVYAQKYRLFLEDEGGPSLSLPRRDELPCSDDEACFDALVDRDDLAEGQGDPRGAMRRAVDIFEDLWKRVAGGAGVDERRALATSLAEAALKVVTAVAQQRPAIARRFVTSELRGSLAS